MEVIHCQAAHIAELLNTKVLLEDLNAELQRRIERLELMLEVRYGPEWRTIAGNPAKQFFGA
jgi:hypothetical protein